MRRLSITVALVACLLLAEVNAAGQRQALSSAQRCGELTADIHALYWKMMQCYTAYAHQQTSPAANSFHQDVVPLSPDYEWGVEASLGYRKRCYGAKIGYVWYENRTVRTLRSDTPNLFPTGLSVASTAVRGVLFQEYQKLDGRVEYIWYGRCGFRYHLFVNGRWVQLDRLLDTESLSSDLPALNRTSERFHGGAFGFGVGCEWLYRRWARLFLEINPMVAIGRRKDFELIQQGGNQLVREVRAEMASLPAVDARAGASLTCDVGCIRVGFDFGWLVNYYANVFPQNIPSSPTIRRVFNCDSIGFSGPFFGLLMTY